MGGKRTLRSRPLRLSVLLAPAQHRFGTLQERLAVLKRDPTHLASQLELGTVRPFRRFPHDSISAKLVAYAHRLSQRGCADGDDQPLEHFAIALNADFCAEERLPATDLIRSNLKSALQRLPYSGFVVRELVLVAGAEVLVGDAYAIFRHIELARLHATLVPGHHPS